MTTFNVTGSNLTIHQEYGRNKKFYLNILHTECKRETIQKLPIWSKYYDSAKKYNYARHYRHVVGYVLTNKCAGVVTCSCYILSSIIVLKVQMDNFRIVPLLHSASGMKLLQYNPFKL